MCPGSLGYAPVSGEGKGMLTLVLLVIVSVSPDSLALIVSSWSLFGGK